MLAQRIADIRPYAVDVYMELVLAASADRVDRQRQVLPRQGVVCRGLYQVGSAPRGLPVVRGAGHQDRRILDAGDAGGWDQQELRGTFDVLQDGRAACAIDHGAGNWDTELLLVGGTGRGRSATGRSHRPLVILPDRRQGMRPPPSRQASGGA